MRNARNCSRWQCAHIALRMLLAQHLGTTPECIEFGVEANKKPTLRGEPEGRRTHFNLTHSGDLALIAITEIGPVGIDVEFLRPFKDMARVASNVFSKVELDELTTTGAEHYLDGFYRRWTSKEALIKASGEGLAADLQAIDVRLRPDEAPTILQFGTHDIAEWQLLAVPVQPAFRAAIAVRTRTEIALEHRSFDAEC